MAQGSLQCEKKWESEKQKSWRIPAEGFQGHGVHLWIKIWEELQLSESREMSVEVEQVKADRTKKDKKEMSQFEMFVADGNEKADGLAKAGATLDEGFMAETRAKTVQQERRSVCSFAVYGQLSLSGKLEEESRRKAQEVDYEVNRSWTAVHPSFSYLDKKRRFKSKHQRVGGTSSVSK